MGQGVPAPVHHAMENTSHGASTTWIQGGESHALLTRRFTSQPKTQNLVYLIRSKYQFLSSTMDKIRRLDTTNILLEDRLKQV
jgi:hypothetical protein